MTTSAPAPQVWHSLRYRDAPAAIEFLTSVFGFRVVARYDNPDDPSIVDHAQLHWPGSDSGIMLGSARQSPTWPATVGSAAAYLSTDDVVGVYERVKAAAFTILEDLHTDDYAADTAARSFAVADPEGNLWSVGTYRGEPIPTV